MLKPTDTSVVCDAMLGRVCTYLRMCGYDTLYTPEEGVEADADIAALTRSKDRVLLTRDTELAATVDSAILLSATDIDGQLQELLDAGFDLSLDTPSRCSNCNGQLRRLPTSRETPHSAPNPDQTPVWKCTECGQLFWQGSHWDDVDERITDVTN